MFRVSHTLWNESLAHVGVMAVRPSVCLPYYLLNHLADHIETCIYILSLEITPPLYSLISCLQKYSHVCCATL